MLRANKTLQSLNLESNFITGAGMQSLVDALRDNDTLTEIKIDNQVRNANVLQTGVELMFTARLVCVCVCFACSRGSSWAPT